MVQRWIRISLVMMVAGLGLLSMTQQVAHAAGTRTWTGLGATDNWSEAANWDSGVPIAGDSLVFPAVAQRKTNENDLPPGTVFVDIRLDGSGYDIDGNALAVSGEMLNQPPGGTNTIRLDIAGTGDVRVISGKLTLSGNNSFDGEVLVQGGVLLALSDTALGGEPGVTTVSSGATLQLAGGRNLGSEGVRLSGHGFDGHGALQSLGGTNYVSDVLISGPVTIGVGNSVLVIGSLDVVNSGGSLTLVGGGKLQVDSTPSGGFAAAVRVVDGNLTWNADEPPWPAVDVQPHGLLRGTGTVASIVVNSGRVWPGSGGSPGILTSTGATVFNSGYFKVDLDGPAAGSEYGQLSTNGISLNLLATRLELDRSFTPSFGQVFRIIDNTSGFPVSGTFRDLPEGAIFGLGGHAVQISYKGGDGNDVTLTVLRQLSADLRLTAEAAPSPVSPGTTIAYTVTLTNHGPDRAISPAVTFGTPVGTTYESVKSPEGWTCSKPSSSPDVQCTAASMASGDTAVFIFRFKVGGGATGNIIGSPSVSSQTNDPASANNGVTLVTPTGVNGALPHRRYLPLVAADR